jgi:hypothetical protein
MVAVKWPARIVVMDRPSRGYFKTAAFTGCERREGLSSRPHRCAWRFWDFRWRTPAPPGRSVLPAPEEQRLGKSPSGGPE